MTEKKTTKLLLTFLILVTCTSYGQTKKKTNEKDTIKHWEVGLDLLWLINKNQVPSTSLFGRYNYVDKKGNNKAIRLRLGFPSSIKDSTGMFNPDWHINTKDIGIYVRPGFEWQKEITTKQRLFYGIDVSTSYSYFLEEQWVTNPFDPSAIVYHKWEDKNWIFGTHLFLGFKYFVTKAISISTETTISLNYRKRSIFQRSGADPDFPNTSGGVGGLNIAKYNVSFTPITVLNISFNF
jgi:hypothetical protein